MSCPPLSQLGLYLIMCVPATLPAAFLAFNQVFISGEPDHWCRVPEVLAARGNLSESQVKRLTIPRVDLWPDHKDILIYEGRERNFENSCQF